MQDTLRKPATRARSTDEPEAEESNFRVRVAREKRERMRARLLLAIMKVCSANRGRGPTVIDEVIQEAEVSRGTFYKYYDSLEEAVSELGANLADEIVFILIHMLKDVEDPAQKISSATLIMLRRAALEPAWGSFVSHTEHLAEDSALAEAMRFNCKTGLELGLFSYGPIEAAIDFHMGLILQSIRRIAETTVTEAYVKEVAAIALIGLGMSRVKATKIVERASIDLVTRAPQFLSWWGPLPTPSKSRVKKVAPTGKVKS